MGNTMINHDPVSTILEEYEQQLEKLDSKLAQTRLELDKAVKAAAQWQSTARIYEQHYVMTLEQHDQAQSELQAARAEVDRLRNALVTA